MSPGHQGHARPGAAWGKGKTRRLATNRPANREFLVPVIHFSLLWGWALGVVGLGERSGTFLLFDASRFTFPWKLVELGANIDKVDADKSLVFEEFVVISGRPSSLLLFPGLEARDHTSSVSPPLATLLAPIHKFTIPLFNRAPSSTVHHNSIRSSFFARWREVSAYFCVVLSLTYSGTSLLTPLPR